MIDEPSVIETAPTSALLAVAVVAVLVLALIASVLL